MEKEVITNKDLQNKSQIEPEIERILLACFIRNDLTKEDIAKLFVGEEFERIVADKNEKYSYQFKDIANKTKDYPTRGKLYYNSSGQPGCVAYLICKSKQDAYEIQKKYNNRNISKELKAYEEEKYYIIFNKEYHNFDNFLFNETKLEELKTLLNEYKILPDIETGFISDEISNHFNQIIERIDKQNLYASQNLFNIGNKKKDADNKVDEFIKNNKIFEENFEKEWKTALEENEKDNKIL